MRSLDAEFDQFIGRLILMDGIRVERKSISDTFSEIHLILGSQTILGMVALQMLGQYGFELRAVSNDFEVKEADSCCGNSVAGQTTLVFVRSKNKRLEAR